ncbi:MAG: MliC family protein [Devosia nanyangense]|nr:MliC family protein [Devosia nanyangense]
MRIAAAALISLSLVAPALAIEPTMQIVIPLGANAQQDLKTYQCEGIDEPLAVQYVNSEPTYLAFVPVEGEKRLFVNALAASGVKYVSGQYVWWTKGASADLYDETKGEDAPPISCTEVTDTP